MKLKKITDPKRLAELHAKQGPEGPMGPQGPTGEQGPKGEKGDRGDDGRGVTRSWVDKDGNLMVEYTDNTVVNAGKVKDTTPKVQGNGVMGGGGFPQNLNQIGNVKANPADGQVLTFDATTNKWVALDSQGGSGDINVDGGAAASVYLPTQNRDGGSASG